MLRPGVTRAAPALEGRPPRERRGREIRPARPGRGCSNTPPVVGSFCVRDPPTARSAGKHGAKPAMTQYSRKIPLRQPRTVCALRKDIVCT